jgi:peptidoglycan/LPS O-acetylase OafA/YrhL
LVLLAGLAATSIVLGGPPLHLRNQDWFRYSFLGYFYWFALGLAIAVVSVAYPRRDDHPRVLRLIASRPGMCWAGAFAIYIVTVLAFSTAPFVFEFKSSEYVLLILLQGVCATLVFLPAVFANPNRGLPARVVGHPVLMWFGLISYGLLLWHGTIAISFGSLGGGGGYWTVLIAEFVIAVPLAVLSYYFIERPLMKLKATSLRDVVRARPKRASTPVADVSRLP